MTLPFFYDKFAKVMTEISEPKTAVRDFYQQVGWEQRADGVFADALLFEDLRAVSRTYRHQCHLRVNRHLPPAGKFLLDAASGPLQYPEYLTYHEHFDYRLCVDISAVALSEARKRLGPRGLYVLADIIDLPFKDHSLDGAISLHTIYHVPAARQERAFAELYRVLRPGGRAAVVYSWGQHSRLMQVLLFPFQVCKLLLKPARKFLRRRRPQAGLGLYFHAHRRHWLEQKLRPRFPYEILVWRSVSVAFLKIFVHQRLGGERLLSWIYRFEEKYPRFCGKIGQYPLIVFARPRE